MELQGSIANDLYSEILQSSNVDSRSTTTQVNNNFHESDPDDLWYDDGSVDEDSVEKLSKASDMDREWHRRHDQFHTIGYRDGLLEAKEAALQEGFVVGFKDSVLAGYNFGLVRGISSAMAALPAGLKEKLVETEETRNKFQQLHESVVPISSTDAQKLFYEDHKRKALTQEETATHSSSETNQENQSPNVGDLDDYHVQLLSILKESPLVEGHFKTN